ncbi:Rid family detoxifying hydrolase [Ramlibacter tataouinensis]|uniref:Uncharacterized protein n=1 Tax=Ramlibacter tataouinensis (strain ATCC BAA-407 / DSM 14655 / LMG 21543 / TTB310) TaxID=365046 RepID=F5XXY9_RAMTT|nr:Rid family detoxifying hydrolase [Ramlibacter tataouinensis]AEG94314.1 conserved hypothetical protein [Ramlibacter tataouinensis TTB310]
MNSQVVGRLMSTGAALFLALGSAGCATGMAGSTGGGANSASKTIHSTPDVYPAIGPYSQIVQAGRTYYISGVLPLNKAGTAMAGTTIEEQTRAVLDHIGVKLRSQGMTYDNVVMSHVYMKDLNEFAAMNKVYGEYFKTQAPARATVEVARVPRDAKIEIAVIAHK